MLLFNFKTGYNSGSINKPADYFPHGNSKLRRRSAFEVFIFSSDVTDEEPFFVIEAEYENESEEQTLQSIGQSWKAEKEWAANEEPFSLTSTIRENIKIDGNNTSFCMNERKCMKTSWTRSRSDPEVIETQKTRVDLCRSGSDNKQMIQAL